MTKPHGNSRAMTMSQFSREVSKAIDKMTYTQNAAIRNAVCLRTPGLRERIVN